MKRTMLFILLTLIPVSSCSNKEYIYDEEAANRAARERETGILTEAQISELPQCSIEFLGPALEIENRLTSMKDNFTRLYPISQIELDNIYFDLEKFYSTYKGTHCKDERLTDLYEYRVDSTFNGDILKFLEEVRIKYNLL